MTSGAADPAGTVGTQDEGDAATATRRALESAGASAGLDTSGAELIRLGSNAVFRLPDSVIARLIKGERHADSARRQVEVARWLQTEQYPATRALEIEQPIVADGYVCTFWVSASDDTEYAPIEDVARLIRELHALQPPENLHLPDYDPFARTEHRLDHARDVSREDLAYLQRRLIEDRAACAELDFQLAPGVIHGDANVGNVILDRGRSPVVIDLDSFAVGHREWDLIQTALFANRLGWHTAAEYRRFVDVYGYDITDWTGYETLADARELLMTVWLADKAHEDGKNAAEVHNRVQAMRTGESRRDWQPY